LPDPVAEPATPLKSDGAAPSSPHRAGSLTPLVVERWCLFFVLLGLAARLLRYALGFPLWEDEAFVCYNYLDRDYAGLREKLDYPPQVAPLLYLWSQLFLVKLFGFHEYALRLTSVIAGVGGMLLFASLAKRFLAGSARIFAVAVFAVSYVAIRYSAEAKPYGIDLFAALALIRLAVTWIDTRRPRDLALLVGLTPPLVGISFTTALVGGGLVLWIGGLLWWRERRSVDVAGWLLFGTALTTSFVALYLFDIRPRMRTDLESMHGYWSASFPPLERPWLIPWWLIRTHASELTAYPFGGPSGSSTLSFLVWSLAIAALVRRGEREFLLFALAPLAVGLAAATLRKYPYGGHFKFNLYAAPAMCLVIGYGLAELSRRWSARVSPILFRRALLASLAAVALVTSVRSLQRPFKSLGDHDYREFARHWWPERERSAEVVCLKRDLGLEFAPATYDRLNFSAVFHCNQVMHSLRQRQRKAPDWNSVSAERPLVCVLFRDPWVPFDDASFAAWRAEMARDYDLRDHAVFKHHRLDHTERRVACEAVVETFEFIPRRYPPAPLDTLARRLTQRGLEGADSARRPASERR
jgi:hypothetical protein